MKNPRLLRLLKKMGFSEKEVPHSLSQWEEFLIHVEKSFSESEDNRVRQENLINVATLEMNRLYKELEEKSQAELAESRAKSLAAAKMASLGEMASGVAHEINNPLSVIQMNAHHILKRLHSDKAEIPDLEQRIEKIYKTTQRIEKIIKGLRSFARDGAKDPFDITSLKTIVEDTLELCAARMKSHDIELIIKNELPDIDIEARPIQLSQVLLNLLNNSHDAILELSEKWVELHIFQNQDFIRIQVTDSGQGIPLSIQEKLMTPFFTTKEPGRGTGLGLSISKGIIESHQGRFFIDNDCKNTRFCIDIPERQSSAQTNKKAS